MISNVSAAVAAPTALRMRFGSGLVFSLVAALFNSGSTFLVNIVVANLLGREIFGEFAIIQNTLLTLSTVASLATGFTATKHIAEFRSVDKAKTARILGLCSALALAMGIASTMALFVGALWLSEAVLKAPYLTAGVQLAAVVVFFNVYNFYQTGALAGLECYAGIARAGVIAGTAYFLLCIAGAYVGGREGALAGLAASACVQWLALGFFLRRERLRQGIGIDYRGVIEERDIALKFSLPAALSGFSSMPALWLANAFLVWQPGGFAQMALYAAATNLRVIVLLVPQLLNNVGTSLLNNAKGLGDTERYRRVFWSNLGLTASVTIVSAFAMALLAPSLLAFFGRSFSEGYPILVVLLVASIVEGLTVAIYQSIQSQSRMWLSLFGVALPRDALIVLIAYALTPDKGAVGLALAYTVGWGVALLSTVMLVGILERRNQNHDALLRFTW
jgi:O-antigen/teichoic acid export membrane protein